MCDDDVTGDDDECLAYLHRHRTIKLLQDASYMHICDDVTHVCDDVTGG